jgi:hypothetical protein
MADHVAVEYWDDKVTGVYHLTFDPKLRSYYKQVRSFEGFCKRMQENVFKFACPDGDPMKGVILSAEIPGQRFHVQWADDFEISLGVWRRSCARAFLECEIDRVPQRYYDDIYEFFKEVGYEYRYRRLRSWAADKRRDRRRRVWSFNEEK